MALNRIQTNPNGPKIYPPKIPALKIFNKGLKVKILHPKNKKMEIECFWFKMIISVCRGELVFYQEVKGIMLIWANHGQNLDCWLSVQAEQCKKVRGL